MRSVNGVLVYFTSSYHVHLIAPIHPGPVVPCRFGTWLQKTLVTLFARSDIIPIF